MIASGIRLGPYEIVERLGSGGMGEVYKANDTRLGRHVAVKVLSSRYAADPVLRKRFLREAKAISSISHSNICSLFDIGTENGLDFLVMELLEGEPLSERLRRGPLDWREALRHAMDIASALELAHRRGIVHRDLKPANIMITQSGAKLLDFGLARLAQSTTSATEPLTSHDTVIGTIEYMAPEQINGGEIDARTDIFAFGVVLYEMLTGTRPFRGETRASIIGAILFSEPDAIASSQSETPPALARIVTACLEKNPDERIQNARDLERELSWTAESESTLESRPRFKRRSRARSLKWTTTAILVTAALGVGAFAGARLRQPQAENEIRFAMTAPALNEEIDAVVLSPDGLRLAFVTEATDGTRALWIRELNSTVARRLPGTEGAVLPFWSPQSDAVAFFNSQQLKVIELTASRPRSLADAGSPRGGAWSRSNIILFAPQVDTGLFSVPANGGAVKKVTELDRSKGDSTHRWPEFLPDNDHFLFVRGGNDATRNGLYLASLSSTEIRRVADIDHRVTLAPPDKLFFVRDRRLYLQRLEDSVLRDQPLLIAENVWDDLKITGYAAFSAAANAIVYVTKPEKDMSLVWRDRSGTNLGTVAPPAQYVNPALSPDGRRLAVSRIDPRSGKNSLWLFDVESGVSERLTVEEGNADSPVWTADGKRILFSSDRRGPYEIYEKEVDRAVPDKLLIASTEYAAVVGARKDALMYRVASPRGRGGSFWLWPTGSTARRPVEGPGQGGVDLAPDSRWFSYVHHDSATSGYELFVQSVEDPNVRMQISQGGGLQPTWSADGKELFYVTPQQQLMVVRFTPGRTMIPQPLFPIETAGLFYSTRDYVPSPDGKRILVQQRATPGGRATATVILNLPALRN